MKKSGIAIFYFLFLVTFLGLSTCKTVPVTERDQFVMVNKKALKRSMRYEYRSDVITGELATGTAWDVMVKSVGERMQVAVEELLVETGNQKEIEYLEWEFNVLVDDLPKAYAIPGGKVMFNTGIMPICYDEDGVAVVMGHELAHVIAHHYEEMYTKAGLTSIAVYTALLFATQGELYSDYGFSDIAAVLLLLEQDFKIETEADRLGLILMARAGYNPDKILEYKSRHELMYDYLRAQANLQTISINEARDSTKWANIENIYLPEARIIYQERFQ